MSETKYRISELLTLISEQASLYMVSTKLVAFLNVGYTFSNRVLYYFEFKSRDLEFKSRHLEFQSRDLEFQSRDLEFQSRDLEFQSRDLEFKDYYGMALIELRNNVKVTKFVETHNH